jgi:hypothetical protein
LFFLFERLEIDPADSFLSASKRKNMRQNSYSYYHPSEAVPARLKPTYRDAQINWVASNFKNGDMALTLTLRESKYQSYRNYKPNLTVFNKTIKHFLNLVHREFLGKNKSKKIRLKVACVSELNASNGLHTHMVLQELPTDRVPKHQHANVLRRLWASMKSTGLVCATRVEAAYDVKGWVVYMFKKSHRNNSEFYDPCNWHLTK